MNKTQESIDKLVGEQRLSQVAKRIADLEKRLYRESENIYGQNYGQNPLDITHPYRRAFG